MPNIIKKLAVLSVCLILVFASSCAGGDGSAPSQPPMGQTDNSHNTDNDSNGQTTDPDPSDKSGDNTPEPSDPAVFTVTFELCNGEAAVVYQVSAGEGVQTPSDPVRSGYVFSGWLCDGKPFDRNAPVTADLTVTASWDELLVTPPEIDEIPTKVRIDEEFGGVLKFTLKEQSNCTYTFEWYVDTDGDCTGGSFYTATDTSSLSLPTDHEAGIRYYVYCVVGCVDNMSGLSSRTVSPAVEIEVITQTASDTPADTPDPDDVPDPNVQIVPDSTAPVSCDDGVLDVFIFGGQMMGSFNMAQTLKDLIEKGRETTVSMTSVYLLHENSYTTYNLWEMFAKDARSSMTDFTFASGNAPQRLKTLLETTALDCLILQTGRDMSINSLSYLEQNTVSACKIAKLAYDKNPNVKILLVAPYGHQYTFGDFSNVGITDHKTHVRYINAEAERIKNAIVAGGYAANVEVVSIGSLFESYGDAETVKTDLFRADNGDTGKQNTGNRANVRGSYLAACGIYAAMFDRSPVGIAGFGVSLSDADCTVSKITALNMQKLAAKFVLGLDSSATTDIFNGDEYYSNGAKALIATADAYVRRSSWVQYDDTRLVKRDSRLSAVYRARRGVQPPELATQQNTVYTNCAAFINSLFWATFDYDIVSWYTGDFIERKDMTVFYYDVTGNETEGEKAALVQKVEDLLVPGDLLVTRLPDESNGHIIMYIGNGQYVHSTGSNYNYGTGEVLEKNGSIRYGDLESTYFNPSSSRYLPKSGRFAVLRPLDIINVPIPQQTLDRMNSMDGIVAQLLTSHTQGKSANPGDTVSYTVSVENAGSEKQTVSVTVQLADGTSYLSGGDSVNGRTLSWNAVLQPGEIWEGSFTVTLSAELGRGQTVSAPSATVNGVKLYCADVLIANTLTGAERTALDQAARKMEGSKSTMCQIINGLYSSVAGDSPSLTNEKALFGKLFTQSRVSGYLDLTAEAIIVPSLYGGWYVDNSPYQRDRIQMLMPSMLTTGDILFVADKSDGSSCSIYLVLEGAELLYMTSTGAKIMNAEKAASMMSSILGKTAFCVLRPSMIFR